MKFKQILLSGVQVTIALLVSYSASAESLDYTMNSLSKQAEAQDQESNVTLLAGGLAAINCAQFPKSKESDSKVQFSILPQMPMAGDKVTPLVVVRADDKIISVIGFDEDMKNDPAAKLDFKSTSFGNFTFEPGPGTNEGTLKASNFFGQNGTVKCKVDSIKF